MSTLTDRQSLLRAFFRLTNTDDQDEALTEHDQSSFEAAYQLLQQGLWDAQEWLLSAGLQDRWVTTVDFPNWGSGADSDWQGSDSSDGGRYATLPSDFLRLAGDEELSALREPDGIRWGKLIRHRNRYRTRGSNAYWLQNENLWIGRGASPPSDLKMDYHQRLGTLADGTTVDFPVEDRSLIVAYAAAHGMEENWLPGGEAMEQKIARNLRRRKQQAWKRARRSREPRHWRAKETLGTRLFV